MPPRALALRHVPFEDLGTLEPVLRQHGFAVSYHEVGAPPLPLGAIADADLLVVLGGPIGIGDRARYPSIDAVADALRTRLQAAAPTLGICLGAQLMAYALGAPVTPMATKEIGFAPLQLNAAGRESPLAELPEQTAVLHWHGDQFAIPDGATLLAGSRLCPHQAFSAGAHALALQFHIEADLSRIEQWLIGHACELALCDIDPQRLRTDAAVHAAELQAGAARVFDRWLRRSGATSA